MLFRSQHELTNLAVLNPTGAFNLGFVSSLSTSIRSIAIDSFGRTLAFSGTRACTIAANQQQVLAVTAASCMVQLDSTLTSPGGDVSINVTIAGFPTHTVLIRVWTPDAPSMTATRTTLKRISNWSYGTPGSCVPMYQRSNLRVLTVFRSGTMSSPLIDVTEYAWDALQLDQA